MSQQKKIRKALPPLPRQRQPRGSRDAITRQRQPQFPPPAILPAQVRQRLARQQQVQQQQQRPRPIASSPSSFMHLVGDPMFQVIQYLSVAEIEKLCASQKSTVRAWCRKNQDAIYGFLLRRDFDVHPDEIPQNPKRRYQELSLPARFLHWREIMTKNAIKNATDDYGAGYHESVILDEMRLALPSEFKGPLTAWAKRLMALLGNERLEEMEYNNVQDVIDAILIALDLGLFNEPVPMGMPQSIQEVLDAHDNGIEPVVSYPEAAFLTRLVNDRTLYRIYSLHDGQIVETWVTNNRQGDYRWKRPVKVVDNPSPKLQQLIEFAQSGEAEVRFLEEVEDIAMQKLRKARDKQGEDITEDDLWGITVQVRQARRDFTPNGKIAQPYYLGYDADNSSQPELLRRRAGSRRLISGRKMTDFKRDLPFLGHEILPDPILRITNS